MRECGILLPVSALPSKYGIGCFSREAYEFIDQLKKAGQSYWQILPLGPTGYGNSPYQSFSSYAGNPYFIDLETLVQEGLITEQDCNSLDYGQVEDRVSYDKLYTARAVILRKAFNNFKADADYNEFISENASWLDDYCLYMAIKMQNDGESWINWPLKGIFLFMLRWTALIHGQTLYCTSLAGINCQQQFQDAHQMAFQRRGSYGEALCITGNTIKRLVINGGQTGLLIVSSFMIQ